MVSLRILIHAFIMLGRKVLRGTDWFLQDTDLVTVRGSGAICIALAPTAVEILHRAYVVLMLTEASRRKTARRVLCALVKVVSIVILVVLLVVVKSWDAGFTFGVLSFYLTREQFAFPSIVNKRLRVASSGCLRDRFTIANTRQ